jgi:hypothetical protein
MKPSQGGFPAVVDESAVTPNNTNGGSNFDTTRGIFDPTVVGEYLSWTGQKGGPLVTSFNETSRSDLRLYESDKNATMHALFAQGAGFLDTCVELLGRAMNTVPSGVQLGEVVNAMKVKPINVTYGFSLDGKLKLSGTIRVSQYIYAHARSDIRSFVVSGTHCGGRFVSKIIDLEPSEQRHCPRSRSRNWHISLRTQRRRLWDYDILSVLILWRYDRKCNFVLRRWPIFPNQWRNFHRS